MDKTFSEAQLNIIDQLIRDNGRASRKPLSDFTKTLEAVLEKQLRAEDYTVFLTNPTTGKTAASVSHVLRVMAFGQVNNWTHAVKNKVKALEENKAFEHHHLR